MINRPQEEKEENQMVDRHVRVFDSTLREGEQAAGAAMSVPQKIALALELQNLGVDTIEAGFPAASAGEAAAVRAIANSVSTCEVAALCRSSEADIRVAWDAICLAKAPLLHVFVATSDLHLNAKLRLSRAKLLKTIGCAVDLCRSLCPRVEFSAEDSTRTDKEFLKDVACAALDHGATIINVPDTVGISTPDEYAEIVFNIIALCRGYSAIVSAHCHDDLGLAVANALAAVKAGAEQVECCINGIGDRAGITALEEFVMALIVRRDVYRATTKVKTDRLLRISKHVSEVIGFSVPPNKAVVGANAFSHQAGIHQHGVIYDPKTYEIMSPTDVGFSETKLVLGKHSGRHALARRFQCLGYPIDADQVDNIFTRFKVLADNKRIVTDDDLRSIAAEHGLAQHDESLVHEDRSWG